MKDSDRIESIKRFSDLTIWPLVILLLEDYEIKFLVYMLYDIDWNSKLLITCTLDTGGIFFKQLSRIEIFKRLSYFAELGLIKGNFKVCAWGLHFYIHLTSNQADFISELLSSQKALNVIGNKELLYYKSKKLNLAIKCIEC